MWSRNDYHLCPTVDAARSAIVSNALEYCGKNQRIAISHNLRIRYTPNELAAVMRHGVALLIVIGDARLAGLASNFVNSMQRIEVFVAMHQPPYIAKVYRASPADLARNPMSKGTISLWYPA